MTEDFETGRSLEEIVRDFTTNYEIYSTDLRETGVIHAPAMLFRYFPDQKGRERLLMGVAAYYALPQSPGERKRLIDEVGYTIFANEEARSGLKHYLRSSADIRHELNVDWRNVLAERTVTKLNDKNHPQYSEVDQKTRDTFKRLHINDTLDMVMRIIPIPGSRDIIQMLARVEGMNLFKQADIKKIKIARAYLEEFITDGPNRGRVIL